jgi:hypothetical protein
MLCFIRWNYTKCYVLYDGTILMLCFIRRNYTKCYVLYDRTIRNVMFYTMELYEMLCFIRWNYTKCYVLYDGTILNLENEYLCIQLLTDLRSSLLKHTHLSLALTNPHWWFLFFELYRPYVSPTVSQLLLTVTVTSLNTKCTVLR